MSLRQQCWRLMPQQQPGSSPAAAQQRLDMPSLLYADDMVLLATSAECPQRQLVLLQQYCQQRGLVLGERQPGGNKADAPQRGAHAASSTASNGGGRTALRRHSPRQWCSASNTSAVSSTAAPAYHVGCAGAARALLAHKAMHEPWLPGALVKVRLQGGASAAAAVQHRRGLRCGLC